MVKNKNIEIFFYKVNFYDFDRGGNSVESGFSAGEDYSSVTKNIVRFYGEECVQKLEISCITDGINPTIIVDEEVAKEIIKKNNF